MKSYKDLVQIWWSIQNSEKNKQQHNRMLMLTPRPGNGDNDDYDDDDEYHQHLLRYFHLPATALGRKSFYLIITGTSWVTYSYAHVSDEETEILKV